MFDDPHIKDLYRSLEYERIENKRKSQTIQRMYEEKTLAERQARDLNLEYEKLKKKYKELKAAYNSRPEK